MVESAGVDCLRVVGGSPRHASQQTGYSCEANTYKNGTSDAEDRCIYGWPNGNADVPLPKLCRDGDSSGSRHPICTDRNVNGQKLVHAHSQSPRKAVARRVRCAGSLEQPLFFLPGVQSPPFGCAGSLCQPLFFILQLQGPGSGKECSPKDDEDESL